MSRSAQRPTSGILGASASAAVILAMAGSVTPARADAPCDELDECRVLIEINASDGDIGFHVLFDAEGWDEARIAGPDGRMLFKNQAYNGLKDQNLTENFFESAEPVCEMGLAEDEDEPVVTLPEFLERFPAGDYVFRVKLAEGGELAGMTALTHLLPPAPADLDFDGSQVSWSFGDDLGECTTLPDGFAFAAESELAAYEVVLEPEDPAFAEFRFATQVPNGVQSVTVPLEYLAALLPGTPLKLEVGAIERRPNGSFGNQTFSEEDGFCSNVDQDTCPGGEE